MEISKQYQIDKRIVYFAYRKVKANKGSPGIDGIGFEEYERNLKKNLYKLWNRMSSGSYFPKKTKIVYCKDKDRAGDYGCTEFDFLGYTFRKTLIKDRLGRLQWNFLASVSKKACQSPKDKIKAMELHGRSGSKIEMIAEAINPTVRGWMNYFDAYNKSAMKGTLDVIQRRLIKWAMRKYKRF